MTIFGFEIRRRRAFRLFLRGDALTEEEMNEALSAQTESHPLYRTVLQLIETARENAFVQAAENLGNARVAEAYVAAGRHLLMLRDDIIERRENMIKERQRRGK